MNATRRTDATVLSLLAGAQANSRRELERPLGLGKAAISMAVDGLIRDGYVCEGAKFTIRPRGRKCVSLRVRPDLGYVVGTDLEGSAVRACLLDSSRTMLATAKCGVGARWTVARTLRRWSDVLEEMLAKSGVAREKVLGIGVGLPGMVVPNRLRTRAYLPPGQWVELDAAPALSRLNLPAIAANNTICTAEYERRIGVVAGRGSAMVVLVRYGIGLALYGNGRFLVGDELSTNELGHTCIAMDGPVCICGRRGCLDEIASGRTLPPASRQRGPAWEKEMHFRLRALGIGMANVLAIFQPSVVVLDGVYVQYGERALSVLMDTLKSELSGLGMTPPELVAGQPVEFKTSIGAALRAVDAFMAPHLLRNVLTRPPRRPAQREQ